MFADLKQLAQNEERMIREIADLKKALSELEPVTEQLHSRCSEMQIQLRQMCIENDQLQREGFNG